jgi:hypothetical protein
MKIIILAVSISILVISLFLSRAEAREVSPFDFQLDESAVDGKRYSYVDSGTPHAIIKQGQNVSLPVIILPATDKPVLVKFHATTDYNQTAQPRMPRGVHVIIEPSSVLVKPHQNTTINIVVNVDSNVHPGKYALNIVGEWEAENGFMGSSIMLHIGRDFGPNAMPYNALWSPLKQYESGIESKDVKCNDGFQRVIKSEDDHPACVKPSSVARLLQQGWMLEPYVDWGRK